MKPLSEVKLKKKNLFKNFFLVTVLSTGISMLANALTKDAQTMIIIVPGTLCILFVAICYFKEFLGNSSYDIEVKSVLTVDDNQKVVPIRRFEFSEDMSETVSSVLTENKAYENISVSYQDLYLGDAQIIGRMITCVHKEDLKNTGEFIYFG